MILISRKHSFWKWPQLGLNRGLSSIFLVTEKYKQCEIYRRIGDMYGETYFNRKCLQMGLTRVCHHKAELKWQTMVIKETEMDTQFFPSRGRVNTAVWMHYVDADKAYGEKLDGNYTEMQGAVLNKSWMQHPTKQQLYGHLLPITKSIQVRQTRHVVHCWRTKVMYSYGPQHMDEQRLEDQLESIYSSSVPIWGIHRKTWRERWTIGTSDERGSRISVQAAWHDDVDQEKKSFRCNRQ